MLDVLTNHVRDVVEAAHPKTVFRADAGNGEDCGAINGDSCDADPLLKDLEPDNQLNTTSCVQFAGSNAEEHAKIAVLVGGLGLQFAYIPNVLELGLGQAFILAVLSTQTTENESSLLFSTDLDQPPG
jgi:hypothetical protein